jgi:hypothetical protein
VGTAILKVKTAKSSQKVKDGKLSQKRRIGKIVSENERWQNHLRKEKMSKLSQKWRVGKIVSEMKRCATSQNLKNERNSSGLCPLIKSHKKE